MAKLNRRKFCECGQCGLTVKSNKRFILGHNRRNHRKFKVELGPDHLCECGKCGQIVKANRRFVSGHNSPSPDQRRINSTRMIEFYQNPLEREKASERMRKVYDSEEGSKIAFDRLMKVYARSPGLMDKRIELMMLKIRGIPRSEEEKRRKSASMKLMFISEPWRRERVSENNRGEKSHFYIDGRSCNNRYYPLDWKEQLKESIRERDGHLCRLCTLSEKENKKKLHVHHIDYDRENLNPDNLVSLCTSCHGKTSTYRSKWEGFFQGIERVCIKQQEVG